MHRLRQIATISLFLLPITAAAQMHGGFHSSGTASSHSFVPLPQGFGLRSSGPTSSNSFVPLPQGLGSNFNGRRFSGRRFSRRRDFNRGSLLLPFGYGTLYPYDYPFGADYQELSDEPQQAPPPAAALPPQYDPDVAALNRRIDRLTNAIETLRDQQDRPAAAVAPALEQQPTTILVFKDKHDEQIQNYAIVSQTLWVLDNQGIKKIPLSQLDLTDTAAVNNERGVRFSVPPEETK